MKINVKETTYSNAISRTIPAGHPIKQTAFWRNVLHLASLPEIKAVHFTYTKDLKDIPHDQPCLFLMNHSSFTDLQIAAKMLKDRQYHIICTNDGFIGKSSLMSKIGCIPTKKFISDIGLIRNMKYAVEELNSSLLMFPEASYSFDGTETPLPESLGKFIKILNIPVVMIRTRGAFLRDPLYNCLQKRKVDVSADMYCLLDSEQLSSFSADQINDLLADAFHYDHFREQKESGITVSEAFRADGLHRALYKCPACKQEGAMEGKGTFLTCHSCHKSYELKENGLLEAVNSDTEFSYVSDWYRWQRESVRQELLTDSYQCDYDVDIFLLCDYETIYRVGEGHLHHDKKGFHLIGCQGQLDFSLHPKASYSLYADYFWYELGDMISIGDNQHQYYCFPKNQQTAIVAKARLATEELYKLEMGR